MSIHSVDSRSISPDKVVEHPSNSGILAGREVVEGASFNYSTRLEALGAMFFEVFYTVGVIASLAVRDLLNITTLGASEYTTNRALIPLDLDKADSTDSVKTKKTVDATGAYGGTAWFLGSATGLSLLGRIIGLGVFFLAKENALIDTFIDPERGSVLYRSFAARADRQFVFTDSDKEKLYASNPKVLSRIRTEVGDMSQLDDNQKGARIKEAFRRIRLEGASDGVKDAEYLDEALSNLAKARPFLSGIVA